MDDKQQHHNCKVERLNMIYQKMIENLERQLKVANENLLKKDQELKALMEENQSLKNQKVNESKNSLIRVS
ncbi:MAG: hypothetical protein HQM10_25710 [Candidatus Riflebacteria bacterium]|nr:hypothetical protein [Candidatus Riflebacteria bacterium]